MPNDLIVRETRSMTKDELIDEEAKFLAKEAIRIELDKQDLPLPKDSALEMHIQALLSARPEFRTLAAERVEAKSDAYSIALESLGITLNIVEPLIFNE